VIAQLVDMIYAVEQRDHDSIAQFLRRDGGKGLLERHRLDGDPDDIVRLIEPIGDPHRRLEGPERLTFDGQPIGVVVSTDRTSRVTGWPAFASAPPTSPPTPPAPRTACRIAHPHVLVTCSYGRWRVLDTRYLNISRCTRRYVAFSSPRP
jgi:hypothetical protein